MRCLCVEIGNTEYVCKLRHSEDPQLVAIRTALKSPLGFLEKGVTTFALPPSARVFTRMVAV